MAEDQDRGILITPKVISTILGVITLITVLFSGVTAVNSVGYRLDKLEAARVVDEGAKITLTNKLDELNVKIVDLTIAINRLEDRYKLMEDNVNKNIK